MRGVRGGEVGRGWKGDGGGRGGRVEGARVWREGMEGGHEGS